MIETNCYAEDENGDIVVREECENCPNSYVDDIFLEWMCRLDACICKNKEVDS